MRKRQQRHDVIRDIIRDRNVKTQRDLANQLQSAGYECTQATISRDIMDMGLVKSREGYYVLPEEMRLQRMVSELVEEVHVAGNLVVVKTFSGGAAGVSAARHCCRRQHHYDRSRKPRGCGGGRASHRPSATTIIV